MKLHKKRSLRAIVILKKKKKRKRGRRGGVGVKKTNE